MENKKTIKKDEFLKKHSLTENQFLGLEQIRGSLDLSSLTSIPEGFNPTVGGYLDLRSLTSIPEGFNPTVGGYLDLSSLTSIPEGFNPTVGGSLDLSSLTSIPKGFNPTVGGSLDLSSKSININAVVDEVKINTNFFWLKDGKEYAIIDSIFCQIITKKTKEDLNIFICKKIGKDETFIIVNKGSFYSHGNNLHDAVSDLEFKIASEKLKNEPINEDTIITVKHYRLITGACEFGVNEWMNSNKISEGITAKKLLPILEKTNAYGLERFKKLINF